MVGKAGLYVLVLLLTAMMLSACGDSEPVVVPPDPEAPTIDSFTASPETIEAGETSMLSWILSGEAATSVTIDNDVGDVTGMTSTEVMPTETTTYTLTASNADRENTETVQIAISGTDPNPNPPSDPPGIDAPERISGELPTSYIMRTDGVYILEDDVTVPSGITLTIEAGATIKADVGYAGRSGPTNNVDLIVDGTLTANGTADNPIIFTSLYDDVGEDSNEDGSNTTPAAQNWGTVGLRSGATGTLTHTQFKYATRGISVDSGTLNADNILVQDATTAVLISASDSPTVSNLTTTRVEYGGVTIAGGQAAQDVTWGKGGALFVITEDVTIPSSATLTVEPGTVIKFDTGYVSRSGPTTSPDLIIDGTVNVNGTAEAPVVFSSLLDDSAGEDDSNGDGSNTAPAAENWGEVFLRDGATASITYAQFKYAQRGIDVQGATLTADQVAVQDAETAIRISASDSPTVSNLTTTRVEYGGVTVSGGQAAQDVTWGQGGAVFIVADDVTVASNATLTVEPGTVVKFFAGFIGNQGPTRNRVDLTIEGGFIANGTDAAPIIFTSLYDDNADGKDSNGDGSSTTPEDGDWGTVAFQQGSTATVGVVEFLYETTTPTPPQP